MSGAPRLAAALALGATLGCAAADSFTLDQASDLEGGHSTLGGIAHAGEAWSWRLESAHSVAPAIDGGARSSADDLRLGAGWRGGAWSIDLEHASWSDSDGTDSRTWGLDLAWQRDGWRLAFEPRVGRIATDLPSMGTLDLERRGFDRSALGGSLEWRGERWTWWLAVAEWDHDQALSGTSGRLTRELESLIDLQVVVALIRRGQYALVDQYLVNRGATALRSVLQTEGLAGLARVVRYQARRVRYAASLNTFALGLSDPQHRIGFERAFDAGALTVEYERLEIPVDGLRSGSWAVGWRWPLTDALDLTLSGGITETERYGSSRFAGLTLQWYLD